MTSRSVHPDVRVLRELLRHLQAWHSVYEMTGEDSLTSPDGITYSLHDIARLYENAVNSRDPRNNRHLLSPRQRQAIQLFLVENRTEREVARLMGVSEDNPVASYATQGLVRLTQLIAAGTIPDPLGRARQGAAA